MENKEKTAVIYARVSSVSDRQNTDRQFVDLRNYAAANGYNVVKEFSEHISGAKKNSERKVLSECLDYCFTNSIDTLLISSLDRLGRDVWEVQENIKLCKEKRLNVYFQKEEMSIFTANGEESPCLAIMISVLGTCAQMERENIKFRLNSGRAQYIANGGKLGRKKGSVKSKDAYRTKYKDVIKLLKKGTTFVNTAKICNVSESTVLRVSKMFADEIKGE